MPFDGTHLSETKTALLRARQLLIDEGWIPECGKWETGPHCIATALVKAAGERKWLEWALNPEWDDREPGSLALIEWNDAQTSVEPILELFDKAITLAP